MSAADNFATGPTSGGLDPEPLAVSLAEVVSRTRVCSSDQASEDAPWWNEDPSLEAAVRYFRKRRGRHPRDKDELINLLSCDEAELDRVITGQVDRILHHPAFQQLEASWRGLQLLTDRAYESVDTGELLVKVLQVAKSELAIDLQGAAEFDQSEFFKKVYDREYGMPGGQPYGILIGDYEFDDSPGDVSLLRLVSGVAAAAFAPFIAGVAPAMMGIEHFGQLERHHHLEEHFRKPRMVKWKSLRESEDARYVGLALPHILLRLPYEHDLSRLGGFLYEEDVTAADGSAYLWGNAAFAFGAVVIQAYGRCGWFADIRGSYQGRDAGGVVSLPAHCFHTDTPGVALKTSLDTSIHEQLEQQLSGLGFISLCDCPDTPYSAFFANQSIQKPREYNDPSATANAGISSMLQYILCASRFAHYLKVIVRDRVGTASPEDLESEIHSWLLQYVSPSPGQSPEVQARFPLREAKVALESVPLDPGHMQATIHLKPHYQLDEMNAVVRLKTKLPTLD